MVEGHRRGDDVTGAMAARLRADELVASTITVEGQAAAAIIDEARSWRADLVVVGTRGNGRVEANPARQHGAVRPASRRRLRAHHQAHAEGGDQARISSDPVHAIPRRLCRCGSSLRPTRPASSSPVRRVYLHCAAATPSVLLQALVDRAPELHDVSVVHLHTEGPGPHLAPEMAGHFRHRALFIGPNARAAVNEGRADYVPVFLSDVPRLFESGALPLDVVFVNATPPDAHGFCSLGTSVEAMHAAIRAAKTVVVQLNRSMPRTLGDSFIHVDDIDLGVEVDVPPYAHANPIIGDVEERIGAHVAALVPDRATLQLGIGAIPAATAMALMDKHDLGIHTEMFTDAVARPQPNQ